MNAGARLALYGAGLVVVFGGAFGIAGAVAPENAVTGWMEEGRSGGNAMTDHAEGPGSAGTEPAAAAPDAVKGLAAGVGGYLLSPVQAPETAGQPGTLSFQIQDAAGNPVREYETSHDRDLHLIVARTDGSLFRHVHPVLDESTGTWSAPWEWAEAGSYRVFADFTPTAAESGAASLTLTRTVQVAGEFTPAAPQPTRVDQVDGFTVSLDGDMVAGSSNPLTLSVARDGEPVTTLEPYLGAFGHLVALRDGDLAYLHVHAEGETPEAGQTAGPDIRFAAQVPTAGRYLLYLDFQVDGQVHTAEFVLDAAHSRSNSTTGNTESTDTGSGPHSEPGH
ncbi:heavy-metal-associated domain-containing protein [Arthrobacter sp. Sa2BUA2]|uniref:Heavy-metal-associated domain-containing protein n=1 Tax=Arthrobacter pullicola TaxID=2762224 RepID=A0ABR8YL24_9MICC|nr:heavy-metal-associated domain-containing protein [Arthrobacter pullicola]MBD8044930.1 heavy-metal-associated domain-containing protein [Arthrobacter pullicola]